MKEQGIYSVEPTDKAAFTERFDRTYTAIAGLYDVFVRFCPIWKKWLQSSLPHIRGPRVLEVSFGTGYLLTQYADKYETHAAEWNQKLLSMARQKLEKMGLHEASKRLVRANVEDLPYRDEYFDCVIVTMAFTGYPDSQRAMTELRRVLKMDGTLIMVDINYPKDQGNCLGMTMTKMWKAAGDLIRNMDALFQEFGFEYTDEEVGGFGSVHLYVATKMA